MVIGNGNVAMDVARMLALTDHELRQTDTADHAIELLDQKQIHEIVVLGRRGPVQAAFTNPEIKELGEMEDADVIVDPADVELDPASAAFLESDEVDKTTRVNVETLREFSQRTPEGKHQRIVLRFLASPVEIKGDGKVESIVIGRNELVEEDGALRAKDTGEREELECGLVLRSVGYTGIPIEGVPFDEKRGLILNEGGRVLDSHDSGHKVGHYTAGWIKRGPSGVIGTNKKDALETVQHLLADVESQTLLEPENPDPTAIEALLAERGVRYVSFEDWQAIDQAEVGRGEPHGRPRVKFVRVEEMLATARRERRRLTDGGRPDRAAGDDRGGAARRHGRGLRRRRRRSAPAGRRQRPPVRGPLADRPAPPGQGRGESALRRRRDPRAVGQDLDAIAGACERNAMRPGPIPASTISRIASTPASTTWMIASASSALEWVSWTRGSPGGSTGCSTR